MEGREQSVVWKGNDLVEIVVSLKAARISVR